MIWRYIYVLYCSIRLVRMLNHLSCHRWWYTHISYAGFLAVPVVLTLKTFAIGHLFLSFLYCFHSHSMYIILSPFFCCLIESHFEKWIWCKFCPQTHAHNHDHLRFVCFAIAMHMLVIQSIFCVVQFSVLRTRISMALISSICIISIFWSFIFEMFILSVVCETRSFALSGFFSVVICYTHISQLWAPFFSSYYSVYLYVHIFFLYDAQFK